MTRDFPERFVLIVASIPPSVYPPSHESRRAADWANEEVLRGWPLCFYPALWIRYGGDGGPSRPVGEDVRGMMSLSGVVLNLGAIGVAHDRGSGE